ncbi:Zinc finger CCCH domain-containing protein 56 [Dichanthelium oligosanthes]|uniref:Zinc finger CCCH domain-containing protein 56 n=1 Tax=Dichanthelium oligosanthes TaxID=888268 RepID=A0A1E5UV64_9POAL|nr:Zinc finger CCCH domain-containing protein 56 [Dichanthelium oligosanthes]
MDYTNAIHIIPDAAGPDAWTNAAPSAAADSGIWATEDDYRQWSADPGYGDRNPSSRAGSEQPPPGKKARGGGAGAGGGSDTGGGSSTSKSRAIGKMFFKTKLCCKFRAGTCPYVTNCNFAHGMEELRKPPPNWQEIVAAHEEATEQREEHQIPIMTSGSVVAGDGGSGGSQGGRAYKGRHCKKFYTEEGCPYGDSCTFLHDEQSKARESVAISLSPTVGGGGYNAAAANGSMVQKPSNWKTRICNKWEMTGYCPFGSKCHFAHGAAELHKYGGGLVDIDSRDGTSTPDSKQAGASAKVPADSTAVSTTIPPHADVYHLGIQSQRPTIVSQRSGQVQRPIQKWKGPDKISRIYGDWIDENE